MYLLQKETGWTDEYILWDLSWANLQMKLADAPYYKYAKNEKGNTKTIVDENELIQFLEQAK